MFPLSIKKERGGGSRVEAIFEQRQQEHPEEPNYIKYVKLFTETTANAIYIQPLEALSLRDKGLCAHSSMPLSKPLKMCSKSRVVKLARM